MGIWLVTRRYPRSANVIDKGQLDAAFCKEKSKQIELIQYQLLALKIQSVNSTKIH